jgi:hypothetical protein
VTSGFLAGAHCLSSIKTGQGLGNNMGLILAER